MKAKEFDRLITKYEFTSQGTDHIHAYLIVDGKLVVRTRRSFGSGELPASDSIRQQLKLNREQLRDAISCRLTRDDYIGILRAKGVL